MSDATLADPPVAAVAAHDPLAWCALPEAERRAYLLTIARRSGRELRLVDAEADPLRGTLGGPRLEHRRTGVRFCFVPGGVTRVGLSAREADVLEEVVARLTPAARAIVQALTDVAVPALPRAVAPFLLAERPLGEEDDDAPTYLGAGELEQLLVPPMRLPREAEWEHAYRAGTATVFPWSDRVLAAPPGWRHPLGLVAMGDWDEAVADLAWVRGGVARLASERDVPGWVLGVSAARRAAALDEPRALRWALDV